MKQTNLASFFNMPKASKATPTSTDPSSTQKPTQPPLNLKRSKPDSNSTLIRPNSTTSKGFKKAKNNSGLLLFDPTKVPKFHDYGDQSKKRALEDEFYSPHKDSAFAVGERVPYFMIADTFDLLGEIRGKDSQERKKKIITNLMMTVLLKSPEELEELYLFCTRRMDSEYLQPDLGVGKEIMTKAGATAVGMKVGQFRKGVKEIGDLGAFVELKKSGSRTMETFFGGSKKDKGRITVRLFS